MGTAFIGFQISHPTHDVKIQGVSEGRGNREGSAGFWKCPPDFIPSVVKYVFLACLVQ